MIQPLGSFSSKAYQISYALPDIGEIVPITVGSIIFDYELLDDVETFEGYQDRILAYGSLLSELNIDPEEVEWNDYGGWEYISDHPLVINEFAVLNDGEVVEAGTHLEPFFLEAVAQEVARNPRRYPKVDGYELAESLLGQYQVSYDEQNGIGHFRRLQEVEPKEVRAHADIDSAKSNKEPDPWAPLEDADALDGTDY